MAASVVSSHGFASNMNDGASTSSNGGRSAVPENYAVGPSQSRRGLVHKIDLSDEWTSYEQSLLEQLLVKYASENKVLRYGKIAEQLPDKTVRDVKMRCFWMNKIEHEKEKDQRRDNSGSSRKHKDKKGKRAEQQAKPSYHATNRANGVPYGQSSASMDSDDGISYKAIGGEIGKLLEQNAQAFDLISANFASLRVNENPDLFSQARSNLMKLMKAIEDVPETMKQMPPLPVKLNEQLARSILPPSYMPQ